MTRSIGPMWSLKTILSSRPHAASRWSEPRPVKGRGLQAPPFPSSAMSLGLGIPWQVALQQSLPPLSQPEPSCNHKQWSVEQFSADSTCLTSRVSQNPPQSTPNRHRVPRRAPPPFTRDLENITAEVLILHDVRQLLAHVGRVHFHSLLLQIGPGEGDLFQ